MSLAYRTQDIQHYKSLGNVDEDAIKLAVDPIVVIKNVGLTNNEQVQVRVLPFNKDNEDKNELPFADKIQYFKKIIRNNNIYKKTPRVYTVEETSEEVTVLLNNFYFAPDGWEKEYLEFLDGFNNPILTEYADMLQFFGKVHISLDTEDLNHLVNGLKGE